MIKKLPILIVLSFFSLVALAQPTALNCGNGRYVNNVFANVTKDTAIIYGANTITKYSPPTATIPVTLKLDFYQPQGDPATKRPLVIVAFGGAFVSGQRSDLDGLCTALAKKGYVAATIDYRLIYPDFFNLLTVYGTSSLINDEVIKACSDMKAAIRFFKKNAATTNTYKIDTTKIFIGGYSAGAITALQTAYMDDIYESPTLTTTYLANGGFEGNTDLPSPNNTLPMYNANGIAGVLNMSGGVGDTSLVDATNPPIYSAQGDADEVVPYNSGFVAFNGTQTSVFLYGSNLIKTRATNVNLNNQLLTIVGGNHASPTIDPNFTNIVNGAATFFQPIVCSAALPISLSSFTVENSNCSASLKWQTASESKSSRYEVEVSADGGKYMKIGSVQSKNAANGASYNYTYKGFEGTAYFRLKMVDADGSYIYSPVQKLSLPCNLNTIQVYPNPAKEQTLITGLKAGMQVQLVNAQGQKLMLQRVANSAMQVSLSNLTSGLYLVQVVDANGKMINNIKLMKE